jgi:large subunit ribosomal protein L15
MRLHELHSPEGATRERIRIGRGHGSGKVKTGGKGTKGQKARTGGGVPPYFEGGQLPLIRKLPYRRGFRNPFRVEFREVNVRDLAGFPEGSTVGPEEFEIAGVVRGKSGPVKVLGQGDLSIKLTVRAHKFSAGARQKIESAGGSVEPIGGEPEAEAEAVGDEAAPSRAEHTVEAESVADEAERAATEAEGADNEDETSTE